MCRKPDDLVKKILLLKIFVSSSQIKLVLVAQSHLMTSSAGKREIPNDPKSSFLHS